MNGIDVTVFSFSPIHLQSQPSAHLYMCHLITFHNSSQPPARTYRALHPPSIRLLTIPNFAHSPVDQSISIIHAFFISHHVQSLNIHPTSPISFSAAPLDQPNFSNYPSKPFYKKTDIYTYDMCDHCILASAVYIRSYVSFYNFSL